MIGYNHNNCKTKTSRSNSINKYSYLLCTKSRVKVWTSCYETI